MKFLRVRLKVGVQNEVDHPALLDDVVTVRHCRCKKEILLDKNNVEALVLQLADGPADLLDDDGSQALGWLVKQKRPRARSQDARRLRASAARRPKAWCPGSRAVP